MFACDPSDFSAAWIEGDGSANWRSATGHGPSHGAQSSGSSVLEIDPGHCLPWHTDSAEETIAVVCGTARVTVDADSSVVSTGGLAVIPAEVPHQVENAGAEILRFIAFYAGTDVVTRYRSEVQPDGSSERRPVG
jgi:quercetin dioxygenase-like cupin family protein